MHRVFALFALAATAFAASPAAAKLKVVTTTTDLADIARRVGGEHVEVQSLSKGWQDPHFVEAKPSLMLGVHRADLLLSVGLDLEIGWLPGVVLGARNPKINPSAPGYFEAADAIEPIETQAVADRRSGDVHPRGNPHFWLDPLAMRSVALALGEHFARNDSENAAAYRQNSAALASEIDRRMEGWTKRLAPFQGRRIVTYHRTLNYFYKRFGLVGMDYVEPRPGIPPSPAHLADLIRRMRAESVNLVLVENFYDRKIPELVASQAGASAKVVPVSVEGTEAAKSWFSLMDLLVETVAAGLGGAK